MAYFEEKPGLIKKGRKRVTMIQMDTEVKYMHPSKTNNFPQIWKLSLSRMNRKCNISVISLKTQPVLN